MTKAAPAPEEFKDWLRQQLDAAPARSAAICDVAFIVGVSHKSVEAWLAGRGPRPQEIERVRSVLTQLAPDAFAVLQEIRRVVALARAMRDGGPVLRDALKALKRLGG